MENPTIDHIDLDREVGFFVRNQGSAEMSIYVYVDENGLLHIEGPINHHKAEVVLRETGIFKRY